MEDIKQRVEEITKQLDGKISCWQENELYWCLKTILKQQEQHEKTVNNLVKCRTKLKEIQEILSKGGLNMWGVFNADGRLVKSLSTKKEAEKHTNECNYRMQSCGFYFKEI